MSFSDRMRSFWDKDKEEEPRDSGASASRKPIPPTPISPATPPAAPPENPKDNDSRLSAREKEIRDLRLNLEKLELETKNRREAHQQNAQLLRMDAEREIKYLERKLQEDTTAWSRELADREKAVLQAAQQSDAGQQEKKTAFETQAREREQSLLRTENSLKEQQSKLADERRKWQDLLTAKDQELLAVKQDLSRREKTYADELRAQESQQKAAKELWDNRLKELEKQWSEKRVAWEQAIKAAEEERLRLNNTFQERQASWQMEQERRLQELTRREERAGEKLAALQAHFDKEAKNWQQMVEDRETQIKELRVKLLLSETDAKGQAEQVEKEFQEKIVSVAQQAQALQSQLNEEQAIWQQTLETKETENTALKEQVQNKLRRMESEYAEKMSDLASQKDTLASDLEALKARQKEQQQIYDKRLLDLKAEETTLEASIRQRMTAVQRASERETLRLQEELQSLEQQKEADFKELEDFRMKSKSELQAKEETLKTLQISLAEQEAAMKTRVAPDAELLTRQVEALKTRSRALDRELVKLRENLERAEKDHAAARAALETESSAREEELKKRCGLQEEKLKQRLDERKAAFETFLELKKEEEARLQGQLRANEKERAELNARLANLPKLLEQEAKVQREKAKKDFEIFQKQAADVERELIQAREQTQASLKSKAGELSALRQTLDARQKEIAATLRTQEQVLASECAAVEKQMTSAQAEMDRMRMHWQAEITRKEQEARALDAEILKQEAAHRQDLEREEKVLAEQRAPLETQRQEWVRILGEERSQQDERIRVFGAQEQEVEAQIQQAIVQGQTDQKALEARFREERARLRAQIDGLKSEEQAVAASGKETLSEKSIQVEHLEEQIRQLAVAHETRKRELMHTATQKSRTLQDMLHQLETELKAARESFPQDMRAREELIAHLNQQLVQEQARQQKQTARYERALRTVSRRGTDKEKVLQAQLARLKEEWAKKLSGRDSEIAALQADLLGKETERQGELDRLSKQFAEERFQLEKSKEELEWKLKDHKEVSERQLAGRQKEVHLLETEVQRIKSQRSLELAQKTAAFEAEKQKVQTAWAALQVQIQEETKTSEAALAAKEQELQAMITKSKQHLTALGEEFNQKVNSWRTTNEALRGQIEQLKQHWTQAQDHWDALRNEKANEIGALRQEVAQWEGRLQSDIQELERTHDKDRQVLLSQLRKKEKELEESQSLFARRVGGKEDEAARTMDEIRQRESAAEAQWQSSLEQWKADKLAVDQEKVRIEQELLQLQGRSDRELREMEETIARLRVEVTFKQSQTQAQQERAKAQNERDLQPLRDQVSQLTAKVQQEKAGWERRLQAKENDLKTLKTRYAMREKRLQDEAVRREKELAGLKQTVTDELHKVSARFETEKHRLDGMLKERRAALAALETQDAKQRQGQASGDAFARQSLQVHRQHLEENVRQLEAQSLQVQKDYEALLTEKETALAGLSTGLAAKDAELIQVREQAKDVADKLRRELESFQYRNPKSAPAKGARGASVWPVFEQGVHNYKIEHWAEAAQMFQECVRQDPKWGAAYQYLALTFKALGQDAEAAWAAEQALETDPESPQLAAWANTLRASLNIKHKGASYG